MFRSDQSPSRALRFLIVGCALVFALALAACGGDDGDDGNATTGGTDGETAAELPAKTIVHAELVGDASESALRQSTGLIAATEALGWEHVYIQGQGDIPSMIQGINGAINNGADAVVVSSTDAPLIAPVFELAGRSDVPVIGIGGGTEMSDQYAAMYQESEQTMSRLLTEQMIEDLGGQGSVASLDNTQISAGVFRKEARDEVLGASDVEEVDQQDSDLADLMGDSRRATAAFLTRNPDLDALWLVYDAMMPPALEVLNQRGNDTTGVYSWFATPSNLEVMRRNPQVKALSHANIEHTGLIALDQLARFFADGTELDPEALAQCEVTYEIVTQDTMPPEGEEALPVADSVAPFVENWDQGIYGEGAGCA